MLEVAVGVIKNQKGEILISKRSADTHQGGLWEFPGGKVEGSETTGDALKRELLEELDLTIESAIPLIEIEHEYEDLSVHLNVQLVKAYQGEAMGMEGQPIKWVKASDLKQYAFPEANARIVEVLNLPHSYPIVDESIGCTRSMLQHLDRLIGDGYLMIQLRAKSLTEKQFKELAIEAIVKTKKEGVRLFVNTTLEIALDINADAVHLNSKELSSLKGSFLDKKSMVFAASCHGKEDLEQAKKLGALFAVLSPVCETCSHPEATPLGWDVFKALVEPMAIPVYALGGVGPVNMDKAILQGACGVSGISAFHAKW
ncbi:MAG: DNA mismatch repair protein MutT [Cycloclasticus sp. symbiont of Bathymodiolus heckerae]|nr:MAG: DNA mismatch repair protein MutT [Cycloclasticus sp. symbiont of Bathymodiolus heckerae]